MSKSAVIAISRVYDACLGRQVLIERYTLVILEIVSFNSNSYVGPQVMMHRKIGFLIFKDKIIVLVDILGNCIINLKSECCLLYGDKL